MLASYLHRLLHIEGPSVLGGLYNVNRTLVAFALFCDRLTDSTTGKAFVTFAGFFCNEQHASANESI